MNFPMCNDFDDDVYKVFEFQPLVLRVLVTFMPSAVVLQCGAHSFTLDKISPFNLIIRWNGDCVRFVRSLGVPTLLLGVSGSLCGLMR